MKNRHVPLVIAGLLAAYLFVHAVVAAFGLYWAQIAGLSLAPFASLFFGFAALAGLCLAAAIGFWQYQPWAVRVWAAASLSIFAAVGLGVSLFGVSWSEYLFEIGTVLVSWPYVVRLQREAYAG